MRKPVVAEPVLDAAVIKSVGSIGVFPTPPQPMGALGVPALTSGIVFSINSSLPKFLGDSGGDSPGSLWDRFSG